MMEATGDRRLQTDCRGVRAAVKFHLVVAAVFVWSLFCVANHPIAASEPGRAYTLKPLQDKPPPSDIRLIVNEPTGWRKFGKEDANLIAFVPITAPSPNPYTTPNFAAQLEVTSSLIRDLKISKEHLQDPNKTSLVTWMSSGTNIEGVRKVMVFDAGSFGKLPIWLVQGEDYSYYLVIIVTDEVVVEVGLKREGAQGSVPHFYTFLLDDDLIRPVRGRDAATVTSRI